MCYITLLATCADLEKFNEYAYREFLMKSLVGNVIVFMILLLTEIILRDYCLCPLH